MSRLWIPKKYSKKCYKDFILFKKLLEVRFLIIQQIIPFSLDTIDKIVFVNFKCIIKAY